MPRKPEPSTAAPGDTTPTVRIKAGDRKYVEAKRKREACIENIRNGMSLQEAINAAGWTMTAYRKARERNRVFRAAVDEAKQGEPVVQSHNGTAAEFVHQYFGMTMARHHILFFQELERTEPGNILVCLWPPDHGKTTTYENFTCRKFALNPNWRTTIASENITISRKIAANIQRRLEPEGPFPTFVNRFGPFTPQFGVGRKPSQPWTTSYFNVYKKKDHAERDYSMQALGVGSSIVSTRTDHLHVDDAQSTKTLNQTDAIMEWFRQDALSRPGEHGITSVVGTRVGEEDFLGALIDDDNLTGAGIMRVIRFPAIEVDNETGQLRPLWPERYSLEQLERQRAKVGEDAWDRNYMQNPGASRKGRGTFTKDIVEPCLNPELSLSTPISEDAICYVTLDPAIGGMNCVLALEVRPEGKLRIVRIREDAGFQRNEQIMQALNSVVLQCNLTGRVTDVVIEAMNFQAGLARDERLDEMKRHYGFAVREHLTGINKYDENIGVASMVESFIRREIEIPWAPDDLTRHEMGEVVRQLYAWKPSVKGRARGNKLRQDRVMALWFGWILWRSRHKAAQSVTDDHGGWQRQGVPWRGTQSGLIVPIGARP